MHLLRQQLPDGLREGPFRFPSQCVVAVLSGTVHIAFDKGLDDRSHEMRPGQTWTIPAYKSYFLWARKGDVVLQVMIGD